MSRFDLAHVDPSESNFDAMGKGVEEGKQPEQPSNKYLSKGLTRSRTDNLVVMRGASTAAEPVAKADHPVKMSFSQQEGRVETSARSVTAFKVEPEQKLSPTEKLEALNWSKSGAARSVPSKAERRAEAKAKGYEGEMCGECGHFSLLRNGTCMKCDTCGATTGCS
jgi:ribonucleoside-diphosphate reductase alpha chain